MAWIPSHQELIRHPKVNELMDILEISRPMTIGYLHMLWLWAVDYAPDGDLSRFKPSAISNACEWPKDPEEFINGLKSVGFVDDDNMLHDWADYGGKYLAQREASRQRARTVRERSTNRLGMVPAREDKITKDYITEQKNKETTGVITPDSDGQSISLSLEDWKKSISEAPTKQKKIQLLIAMLRTTWGKHLEADAGDLIAALLNQVRNDGARAASLLWSAIASDPQGSVIRMAMSYAHGKQYTNGAKPPVKMPTLIQQAEENPSFAKLLIEQVERGERQLANATLSLLRTIVEDAEISGEVVVEVDYGK